jgi:hypothetical protein
MAIPKDIIDWFRAVFADANRRLSEKMLNAPATPEPTFDLTFIEHLTNYAAPRKFKSDWAIRIDTHYLGGLRHFRSWEVADIGVFVFFTKAGRMVRRKVALLQSKRLFPTTGDVDHLEEYDFRIGMARIAARDSDLASMMSQRRFSFTKASKYQSLTKESDQVEAIRGHMEAYGIPIHYLFYNPPQLVTKVVLPLTEYSKLREKDNHLGARVIPTEELHKALAAKAKSYSPTLGDTRKIMGEAEYGWRLEYFMADLLLGCKGGFRFTRNDEVPIQSIFYRRSGPIAAAIAVTVEMPEGAELPE